MIILDTNVLSELMKASPAPQVMDWINGQPAALLFITSLTMAEILHGVALLASGERRFQIAQQVQLMMDKDFKDRILPFDSMAAREFAEIAACRKKKGLPLAQIDGQIAAIAKLRGATLATRNVSDFRECGITLYDPWIATART